MAPMGGGPQLFWEAHLSISLQPRSDYENFERSWEEAQKGFIGPEAETQNVSLVMVFKSLETYLVK